MKKGWEKGKLQGKRVIRGWGGLRTIPNIDLLAMHRDPGGGLPLQVGHKTKI
jgi:hypothetical protein